MKKPNHFDKYGFRYVAGFFLTAAFSFLMACGNKSGDNNPPPVYPTTPYGFQNCLGCQNVGGAVFFTAQSTDYNQVLNMTWSFSGQNTAIAQTYPYNVGVITPGTYYGIVSAAGQMTLTQPVTSSGFGGLCAIPAGVYTLVTIQPGQWGSGIVNSLGMQAVGPASLVFSFMGQVSSPGWLQNGQLSSSTNPTGRMFGNLQITTVNGQACAQTVMVQ